MIKKEKPILLKAITFIFLFIAIEAAAAFYFFVPKQISGFSITDVANVYSETQTTSKIFLIVQVAIILLIILIVFTKNRNIKKRNEEKSGIDMHKIISASKTSLDALYIILQMKKHLRVRSIAGLFEIKEELAMEWARILESGSLARIEYPGFGGPVLVIIGEKKKLSPPPIKRNIKPTSDKETQKHVVLDTKAPRIRPKIIPKIQAKTKHKHKKIEKSKRTKTKTKPKPKKKKR